MKLLFVSTLYYPNIVGGAERVLQVLTEGLIADGHEAVVVSLAPDRRRRTGWVNGVKVHYLPLRNLYWPFGGTRNPDVLKPLWHAVDTDNRWMGRMVARILDEERPDLVHTHVITGFSTAVWWQVKRRNLPLVHTLHDYYLICPRTTMHKNAGNCARQCRACTLYSALKRRRSGLVDAVVGVSRFILDRHLNLEYFASTQRSTVIHNGCQTYITSANRLPATGARLRIGYLGRLHPTKGIECLLTCLGELPKGRWELTIGGRGSSAYESMLRERYRSSSINYRGFISPEEFLESVDILVVPSQWNDPLPTVIIEAYAHGIPVIGSFRGGIVEMIEDGKTGFLFEPNTDKALSTAIRRFIDTPDLAASMRDAVLHKARQFGPENTLNHYLSLYQGIFDDRNQPSA